MSYDESEWDFSAGRQAYEPGEQALNHPAEEFDLSVGPPASEFDLGLDDDDEEDEEAVEGVVTLTLRERIKPVHIAIIGVIAALVTAIVVFSKSVDNRVPGTKLMAEYTETKLNEKKAGKRKVYGYKARHLKVLEWISDGNVTTDSLELVTIKKEGKKGTTVEFEVMPHELRVGTDEDWFSFPLDGPYSLAACKILDLDLPTRWMGDEIRAKAFENKANVHFIAQPEIRKRLGQHNPSHNGAIKYFRKPKAPDGVKMMSAEFIETRNLLLRELLAKEGIEPTWLISGHFKEVNQDPGQFSRGLLSTYPGYGADKIRKDWKTTRNSNVRLVAANHGFFYFDYSHGVHCVKPTMKVDGKTMTIVEFYSHKEYRKEFLLSTALKEPSYKYSPELQKWMEENGYAEETSKKDKKKKKK